MTLRCDYMCSFSLKIQSSNQNTCGLQDIEKRRFRKDIRANDPLSPSRGHKRRIEEFRNTLRTIIEDPMASLEFKERLRDLKQKRYKMQSFSLNNSPQDATSIIERNKKATQNWRDYFTRQQREISERR